MPTLVFDIRTNHDTGVSRYGLATLAAATGPLADAGWRQIVVAQPHQVDRAEAAVAATGARVLPCHGTDRFVRRTPWLRDLLVDVDADLYYTTHYMVDRMCPVPYVFTIHDLTRLRYPRLSYTDSSFARRYGADELRLVADELVELSDWDHPDEQDVGIFSRYFRALTHSLAECAEHVVTVSASTALDLVNVLGIDPRRLTVVPSTVNTGVFHRRGDTAVTAATRRYGIGGPYLMFVGLTHPNKRLPWLLEHLVRGRDRMPARAKLVAVGGYAEQAPDVARLLSRPAARDFVAFTGRVNDDELAALYSGAAALVTASISEGSNLPPQEALSCGCQVIATDLPVHRETLGDAASFFSPECGEELVDLAVGALGGHLPDRARAFRPPDARAAGRGLANALTRAAGLIRRPEPVNGP